MINKDKIKIGYRRLNINNIVGYYDDGYSTITIERLDGNDICDINITFRTEEECILALSELDSLYVLNIQNHITKNKLEEISNINK